MAKLFIPKEIATGERRVAAVPETIKKYVKAGIECVVEAGAGELASVTDDDYREAGASIASDALQAWSEADIVMKVAAPTVEQAGRLKEGSLFISFIAPHKNLDLVQTLLDRKVSSIAMELIPRTTKAQTMDALSSQANIAGYKAVLLSAWKLPTYFPLLMTAAGTIKPARVVIMGAGVAGLQAIATAKRLGAIVEVSDIRPVVEEQVKSLGGRFIPLPDLGESGEGSGGYAKEMTAEFLAKQREIVAEHVAEADVVICTALIPGKKAPVLVTEDMVKSMKKGAVIVDLAVEAGGNCPLSKLDEEIEVHGVQILGWSNLASTAAKDASLVYARNLDALLTNMFKEGAVFYDLEEEITAGSLLTHEGSVTHEPTAQQLKGGLLIMMGTLLIGLYLFVLSMFVGFEIITKIPPTLHTPLMSGANAISGITIVGALIAAQGGSVTWSSVLGAVAITFATINVVGGYMVTDRMLKMFGKKK